jgi:2'-5' RNA ligase
VAELDDNTQDMIKKFEKIILENGLIGKQTKDIPYHITLGRYSVENEDYLKDLLDKITCEFNAIDVSYSGFGLFGLNVLYLNPCMNIKLIELYNFVKEKSLLNNDFAAHTTLLIDDPENIVKILPEFAKAINNKITGKINQVSLYEFFPIRFIKKIELKE